MHARIDPRECLAFLSEGITIQGHILIYGVLVRATKRACMLINC